MLEEVCCLSWFMENAKQPRANTYAMIYRSENPLPDCSNLLAVLVLKERFNVFSEAGISTLRGFRF